MPTITIEEANLFNHYISQNEIIIFCIDHYEDFNKFQLNGHEPYIFTEEELLEYEREMKKLWNE